MKTICPACKQRILVPEIHSGGQVVQCDCGNTFAMIIQYQPRIKHAKKNPRKYFQ